jgi:predicted nucleotidyltransferase
MLNFAETDWIQLYGLNTPQSDTDIKGVFALSEKEFYGMHYS